MNLDLFPDSVFTYDALAKTYLKIGDQANALKYFKEVAKLDPNNQRVKNVVADLENGK